LMGFALLALVCSCANAQFDRSATEYPIEAANQPPLVETKLFKVVKNADGIIRDDLESANLVIGIMSAPAHFDERNALRQSWIQFQSLTDPKLNTLSISEKKSIVIRFIIGDSTPTIDTVLQSESATYRDIVRVPVTESYFNLTLKTAEFFKWVQNSYRYKWAMKCDDDSFVRVDLVLQELLQKYRNTERLYMGKIWVGTPADRRIDSQTPWKQYPPFAAGAGYVLGADLVSYVTRNLDMLFKFPLEDVAVGSWIAALRVTYVDHPHFHSLPEGCDRAMLVQNPANITVMKQTFFNAVKGIPCHNKPDPFDRKTENVTDHVLLELGIPKPDAAKGVQSMLAMPEDMFAERDEDVASDGMNASLMNSNLPSTDVVFNMNHGPGTGDKEFLVQSSHAALDRMNVMAGMPENELA